jgi:hypothetical protein
MSHREQIEYLACLTLWLWPRVSERRWPGPSYRIRVQAATFHVDGQINDGVAVVAKDTAGNAKPIAAGQIQEIGEVGGRARLQGERHLIRHGGQIDDGLTASGRIDSGPHWPKHQQAAEQQRHR